jgi:anti-sigma factor ChrR (cupin superfamily)
MRKNLVIMTLTIIAVSAWSYSSLAVFRPQLDAPPPASRQAHTAHKIITPDAIQWTPGQSGSGSEIAVLSGNPAQEGVPFVLRIKLRSGIKVPPHWHPTDEHLTVISGIFHIGTGEKFDQVAAQAMPAGSYLMMPKEM